MVGEDQRPRFLSSINAAPSHFSQNTQSYCQVLLSILPLSLQITLALHPFKKNIRATQELQMNEKAHFFSTEQSLKRRTRILAKAIFLQQKILQVQKKCKVLMA